MSHNPGITFFTQNGITDHDPILISTLTKNNCLFTCQNGPYIKYTFIKNEHIMKITKKEVDWRTKVGIAAQDSLRSLQPSESSCAVTKFYGNHDLMGAIAVGHNTA